MEALAVSDLLNQIEEQPSTSVMPIESMTAVQIFAPEAVLSLLERIEREVRAIPRDISTDVGRKRIASLAAQIARRKVWLDDLGKDMTEEDRLRINRVNAERRIIRERLDALKIEIRAELTTFEAAEESRIASHEQAIAVMVEGPHYGLSETAAEIEARIEWLQDYPGRDWREFADRAAATLAAEISRMRGLLVTAQKREADAAELDRLRAENERREAEEAERQRQDREAEIAAQAAQRAREEAETRAAKEAAAEATRVEAERLAAETKAEAERQAAAQRERDAQDAAEAARKAAAKAEADRIAAAEKAELDRIAAAKKAQRDQDAAIEAERRRVADKREAQRKADELRAANQAHRSKINRAACDAIEALGVDQEKAVEIITAIAKGAVPHVSISY